METSPCPTPARPPPEPFRVADGDLDDLASTLAKTMAEVRQHGVILDRLGSEPSYRPAARPRRHPRPRTPMQADDGPTRVFILALGGEAYATELAALSRLGELPVPARLRTGDQHHPARGATSGTNTPRPWPDCTRCGWPGSSLTDAEAGLSGPSTWHRDHLDQALVQLRAPDGPFAACTTSPTRPNHRVLATPAPATSRRCRVSVELDFALDGLEPADLDSEQAESVLGPATWRSWPSTTHAGPVAQLHRRPRHLRDLGRARLSAARRDHGRPRPRACARSPWRAATTPACRSPKPG